MYKIPDSALGDSILWAIECLAVAPAGALSRSDMMLNLTAGVEGIAGMQHTGTSELSAGKLVVEKSGSPMGHLWVREKGLDHKTRRKVWMYTLTPEGRSHLGEYNPAARRLSKRIETIKKYGVYPGDLVRSTKRDVQLFEAATMSLKLHRVAPTDVGIMLGWAQFSMTADVSIAIMGVPDPSNEIDAAIWGGFTDIVPIVLMNGVRMVIPPYLMRKVKRVRI